MPKQDFSKTCIYVIKPMTEDLNFAYVSSTTNIKSRKNLHKTNAAKNVNEHLYNCINEHGGWENWEMVVLEKVRCDSKSECVQKENEWIEKMQNYKVPPILLNFPPILLNSPPNLLNFPPISEEALQPTQNADILSDTTCKFCKKTYTRKDNLKRHLAKCKVKIDTDKQAENIKSELEECKKIIAQQQNQLIQTQSSPRGGKRLAVRTTNNNNNSTNNTNNNTNNNSMNNSHNTNIVNNINNNITYRLEMGNENLHERLTALEKRSILDKMHSSLIEYIKLVHFSGKYPECMNFFCTNLRSNHAQVYNEEQKQFITQFASDFFNTVIDTRLDEINTMFDEHKDELEKIKIERLNKFFESMESTADNKSKRYMETIADVKMLAYNNKHKFDAPEQAT